MPIYTYECRRCGYTFDDLAPMDSIPERPCRRPMVGDELCDGTAVRIPSVPSPPVFNCSMPTYQKPK